MHESMSDTPNCNNIYGPAAQLVQNGAPAYVSPYNTVSSGASAVAALSPKDFPRDRIGKFTGR